MNPEELHNEIEKVLNRHLSCLKQNQAPEFMYQTINLNDVSSKMEVHISLDETTNYMYFFKNVKGKIFRFSQTANDAWRVDEIPLLELPESI